MARYNTPQPRNQNKGGAVFPAKGTVSVQATAVNHEGRTVWKQDEKSELFFRATSAFAGQDTYYEKASKRDARLIELVQAVAVADWDWTAKFLVWLRSEGNMRTAPVMLAVEAVRARLVKGLVPDAGTMTYRQLITAVLQRADEPGEMLAYLENVVGRTGSAKPIKRGIGDAAKRLFNERNFLRYNSATKAIGFGGVAEMAQMPKTTGWQADLIRYAIDMQHGNAKEIPESLATLAAREAANKTAPENRAFYAREAAKNPDHPLHKAVAGQWEWVLSWLGSATGISEKEKWELVYGQMGIMAIVRNLRNFDEAGFKSGDALTQAVCDRLMNAEQIAKSRMFPFRFFTAYLQLKSVTWLAALEMALQHSLQNIPELPGKTLVLVDTSDSMNGKLSANSQMSYVKAAALFGVALKVKNPENVNLWGWADGQFEARDVTTGHSVLRCAEEFASKTGIVGHGTNMAGAVSATYNGHDRVIIISDMQCFPQTGGRQYGWGYVGDVASAAPAHVPVYGFNLAAGSTTPLGQGNRHSLGGLTDATFKLIPQLEKMGKGSWPWE